MELVRAIDYFLSASRSAGRTDATIRAYGTALYRFSRFAGDIEVESIDRWVIRDFIDQLRSDGVSQVTIASYIRHVKAWMNWLEREDIRPGLKISVPRFDQPDMPLLTAENFWRLLDACDPATDKGRRDIAIMMFLMDSGVRVGELVTMETDAVDMRTRTARVRGKARRYRTVFFGTKCALAMSRYQSRKPRKDRGKTFFTGHGDRPLSIFGVRQVIARIAKGAGVPPPYNPHAFRHTMATSFLRAGGDPAALQRILGHTDISTTIKNYSHLVNEDLKETHDKYGPLSTTMARRRAG